MTRNTLSNIPALRGFLIGAICFQLSFGQTIQYAQASSGNSANQSDPADPDREQLADELAKSDAELSPEDREKQRRMRELPNEIERGNVELSPQERDPELESNQRVRIYNGKAGNESRVTAEYDPLDLRVEIPGLAYTGLNFRIENGDLIIEATRGADREGKNGVVVADQIRTGLNAVTVVRDGELVTIIQRDGSVRVLVMEQIVSQLFAAPLSFYDVYKPLATRFFGDRKITARYLTRGISPEGLRRIPEGTVLPTSPDGKPELTAGDLVIMSDRSERAQDGSIEQYREIEAILSREIIYRRIEIRSLVKAYMAIMIAPNQEKFAIYNDGLAKTLEKLEVDVNKLNSEDISLIEKQFLQGLNPEQVGKLKAVGNHLGKLREREYDSFTFEEWKKSFAELRANALASGVQAESVELLESKWQNYTGQVRHNGKSQAQIDFETEQKENATDSKTRQSTARKAFKNATGHFHRFYKQNKISVFFLVGGAAMFAAPLFAESAMMREQFKALAKAAYNYLPDVLKDTAYRVPLFFSTVALIAFWPVAVAISVATGLAIKAMDKLVSGQNTAFARKVRDLNKNWGSDQMSTWQRINTLGFRIYAFITLSVFTRLAQQVFRQRSLVTALMAGVSPTTIIDPKSELGKMVGADRSLSLGLNNPLAGKEKLEQETQIRQKAQAILAAQRNRAEARAWLAAALAVSHESGIDISTLTLVAKNGLTPEILTELNSNGRSLKAWYVVADEVSRMLIESNSVGLDERTEVDTERLVRDVQIARKVADDIKAKTNAQFDRALLKTKFRRSLQGASSALFTFGMPEYNFLSKVYASKQVSEMVRSQFVIDYILCALIPAFFGDRANLNKPADLSAKADGPLWTNPPHLMDMVFQLYIYYFVAGSRYAMVYQKPKMVDERIYAPKHETELTPTERMKGARGSMRDIIGSAFNFDKSDVGGYLWQSQLKRLKTIQAGATMDILARVSIAGMAPSAALKGWAFSFAAMIWPISMVWEFVNRGLQVADEKVQSHKEALKLAQDKIHEGLRRSDLAKSREGYSDLLKLYVDHSPAQKLAVRNYLRQLRGETIILPKSSEAFVGLEDHLVKQNEREVVENHRSTDGRSYWGIMILLKSALDRKDYQEVDSLKLKLSSVLRNESGAPIAEIEKMNAESLLQFSAERSPVFTELSHFAREGTTLIGAVTTTVLAISIMVMSFKEITWLTVGAVWGISHFVLFPIVLLTMSKAGRSAAREFISGPRVYWQKMRYGTNPDLAKRLEAEGKIGRLTPSGIGQSLHFLPVPCRSVHGQ